MRMEYYCGPEFSDLSYYGFTLTTPDGYVYQLPKMGEVTKATFIAWQDGDARPDSIEWALPPPMNQSTWTFELRGWGDGPNHPRHDDVPFDDRPLSPSILISYDGPDEDRTPDSIPNGVYTLTLFDITNKWLASQRGVLIEDGNRTNLWGLGQRNMRVSS